MRHTALRVLIPAALLACKPADAASEPMHAAHAAVAAPNLGASYSATPPPAATLDPSRGVDVGMTLEAYLGPHQEPDEESNTPQGVPQMFRSTTPSLTRAQRDAAGHRGHGQLRFSKDLSRLYIDVKIEGVDARTVNMFHIHCGKPGILGPILIDLSLATDLKAELADGHLSVEIRNEHIVGTAEHGHGLIAAFTAGCVIPSPSLSGLKPTKVSTVAGVAQLALERELYFNLHTTSQTYFGDLRGQIHPIGPQ